MSVKDTPPRAGRRASADPVEGVRRISGSLALLLALCAMDSSTRRRATTTPRRPPLSTPPRSRRARSSTRPPASPAMAEPAGRDDRGPSLVGVGQAATYFQVSTGRMPADENGAQMPRKRPFFTDGADRRARRVRPGERRRTGHPAGDLRATRPDATGGELFRLNCASCHNFTGQGGALSQGKYAPNLDDATDTADLRRDAHRPGEHAEVRRRPADPRREEGDHRLHPEQQGNHRSGRLRARRVRAGPRRPDRLPGRAWVPSSPRRCGSDRGHERARHHRSFCRSVTTTE